MATQNGANIGFVNHYAPGDNGWSANMNKMLRLIDTLAQGRVINSTTSAPPGSPAEGDAYIIAGSPTGAWTGFANSIARWSAGLAGWDIVAPKSGWMMFDVGAGGLKQFSGSAWGGVALSGGTMTAALNDAPPVTLASAATVNIGAAAANTISISGTTTITAFDAIAAGATRRLIFSGSVQLTYNAISLILPTLASIATAAGDSALFVSLGSGNWRCVQYQRADGSALVGSGASSSSVSINTQTGTTYTLVLGDAGYCVEMNNAAANTLTVPPNSSVPFPVGTNLIVRQMGAGQTAIAAGAGVTIRNASSLSARAQYSQLTLHKRATDEWVLGGDMA